jgi:gamma-glutamyl hercynylcysteine S-oxide synthase
MGEREAAAPFIASEKRMVKMRRRICGIFVAGWAVCALAMIAASAAGQDTAYAPRYQQFPAPDCLNLHFAWENTLQPTCPPGTHQGWLGDLKHWRNERRIRTTFDPARYEMPALEWTQSSFIQPQMMVHDRYFYDPVAGKYTVDRYLDD